MWAAIVNALIGLWVMISPGILPLQKMAADNNHITGPIAATFAITALWEVNRNARYFNLITGLWLILSGFVLGFAQTEAYVSNIASGLLMIVFCFFKGTIKKRYGGGWRSLWQKNPVHMSDE